MFGEVEGSLSENLLQSGWVQNEWRSVELYPPKVHISCSFFFGCNDVFNIMA